MNVTEKLSQLIQERGWSEYRLAKESNLPHSTILNIFRRKNLPSIVTLDAICKGLGITLSQFFSDDETMVMLMLHYIHAYASLSHIMSHDYFINEKLENQYETYLI